MVTTNNSNGKRLLDSDIRTILQCMTNNEKPPDELDFSIIRIPKEGTKLSPPTIELENGLYVLLRSPKDQLAKVPSTLSDRLLTDKDLASLPACPWSLSGPQYPKRKLNKGMIQQRYCYPRGKTEFSIGRGGAMWTMINKKGDENIDCRVLHVYESHKRADKVLARKATTNTRGKSLLKPSRQSKRKKSINSSQENNNNKKSKIDTEGSHAMQCPSLMQGDLLKSPPELSSFESIDQGLNFNSDNLFDTNSSQVDNNFSFIPVQAELAGLSAVAPSNPMYGYYYGGQYAHAASYGPPPLFDSNHAYPLGDWENATATATAPSIPELDWPKTTTMNDTKTASIMSVDDFSKNLKDIESSLNADVEGSVSTDQAIKLHLLQKWTKAIAMKPLQPKLDGAIAQKPPPELHSKLETKVMETTETETVKESTLTTVAESMETEEEDDTTLVAKANDATNSQPMETSASNADEATSTSALPGTPHISP